MTGFLKPAMKWTAIAIWFDISDRLIGGPLDWLFAQSHWTAWLDGFYECHGREVTPGRRSALTEVDAARAFAETRSSISEFPAHRCMSKVRKW
jgi:hypothetical protein